MFITFNAVHLYLTGWHDTTCVFWNRVKTPVTQHIFTNKSALASRFWCLYADVIHTVGPRGEKPELLRSCYHNCLEKMLKLQQKTIVRVLLHLHTLWCYIYNKWKMTTVSNRILFCCCLTYLFLKFFQVKPGFWKWNIFQKGNLWDSWNRDFFTDLFQFIH